MSTTDTDVIIIGAGHNSLTAALYLLKAGYKVLIIELARRSPVGRLRPPSFSNQGSNMIFTPPISANSWVLVSMLISRISFIGMALTSSSQNSPFANVFPDRKCIRMYTDPSKKLLKSLNDFSAHDAESWKKMVSYFTRVSPYLFPVLQLPMPSLKLAINLWKMYRKLGMQEVLDLMRILVTPTRGFVKRMV